LKETQQIDPQEEEEIFVGKQITFLFASSTHEESNAPSSYLNLISTSEAKVVARRLVCKMDSTSDARTATPPNMYSWMTVDSSGR
jgi:hypothetical protein